MTLLFIYTQNSMSTTKQKALAREIVKNSTREKPLQKKEMLVNVGYSENVAKAKPEEIIQTEGVQEELAALGFTEENAMNVVSEVMLNPDALDKDRLKASEMVFKVKGTYAPEKKQVLNANIDLTNNKEAQSIAEEYEEKLKGKLLE